MDRNVEILLETIADNIEVLKKHGDIDIGLLEDVCDKLNWDLYRYLEDVRNTSGRFK